MKSGIIAIVILAAAVVFGEDLPERTTRFVKIAFYYDVNLNGKRDPGEAWLTRLEITASGNFRREAGGALKVPGNQSVKLRISGVAPGGKQLTIATYREPAAVVMLPVITLSVSGHDETVGLSDGFMTSPLRPDRLLRDDYRAVLRNPAGWKAQCAPLYPPGWSYDRNYFFYGYRIPSGVLKGTPHLAFDLWAKPGTPVLACAPGVITKPLFDWRFGISGPYGTVYYNHIVPAVAIGDKVKRYDVVGYIADGQGNHVHLELRPDPALILEAFSGANKSYFIKSPMKGESLPVPPYFGSN